MQKSSKPSVSVVIPNFNGRKLLERHLPAVIKAVLGAEIIVVDDASTDDSVAFLRQEYPNVRVLALPKNVRFARACNAGVEAAMGDVVILLNTDVVPEATFLSPLLTVFEDDRVFAAGCKEVQTINHRRKESGRSGGRFTRGLVEHWRTESQEGSDTFWAAGGSAAFRRSIWEELHGFDPLFTPAYEEDRDLCYRALKRGYTVAFVPESVVWHNHETTNMEALGRARITASSLKNHLLFVWKNITSLRLSLIHWAWLPYHLLVTGVKTKGLFWWGFCWALWYLPRTLSLRSIEVQESRVTDEALLAFYSRL
jgi:O-antigen biosynthesis protein